MAAPATDCRKTRWLLRPLIGWNIFDFSSETTEQNSMKLDRKQDLNVVYQVCVFHPGQSLKKGGTLYSGARYVALWASCFCNHCMAFIKTWQEANTSSLLQSLCFLDLYVKKNGKPDLWLADTFSILLLQLLCKIEQNIYIFTFREGNMGSLNTLVFICFQYQAFS